MQTMLRMVEFGDNAGSGFPTILATWRAEGWIEPRLVENTSLNQVTLELQMKKAEKENVIENVIEISEKQLQEIISEYSKKKIAKAFEILKMIINNPQVSIDEMRIALDVTDRTIARYIYDLKENKVIERIGPDNGGFWKILL